MKIVMKVLIIMLLVVSVKAEVLFNLQDQYFSNTLPVFGKMKKEHKMIGTNYDTKNFIVSTNSIYQEGVYTKKRKGIEAYFSLKAKNDLLKAEVNIKIVHGPYSNGDISTIRFMSISGKSVTMTSEETILTVQDKSYEVSDMTGMVKNISLSLDNNKFELRLNGSKIYSDNNFDGLKMIEMDLEQHHPDYAYRDKLQNITISK